MAKWGEGDPRWIVEERPDATNVNNWHWTEKNAGPWSKDRLKELFQDLNVAHDNINCRITEIEKLEGEASANNRKGKLIFFYEWDIALKWEGKLPGGSGDNVTGNVKIPNLSEENDVDEVDITVTIKEKGEEAERLKQFMHNIGRDKIRKVLSEYIRSLKEEFSQGLILPKKGTENVRPDNVSTITSGFNRKVNMAPIESAKQNNAAGLKLDVRMIEISEKFQCKAQELYDALTRIEMVTAFTRGHVKLELEKGGKFALFGGNITGQFKELVPGKKIVQSWRYKQWPENHYSDVTIEIEEKSDHTMVKVRQQNVPTAEEESTRANWQRYYFDSIKQTFGFGVFL